MNDVAIRAEGLSKEYLVGHRQRYQTLRESIVKLITSPKHLRRPRRKATRDQDDRMWAVKDATFEIKAGEVIGVVGRNGAGKSTLLKLLSRITDPTEGSADIYGRVGSLLEVGTGFHNELTGRENVLLNGAILGMKRFEIQKQFDNIVAFAEVERFIDMPVKHYSSGMYLRLAFAVAAHLEPDTLLVDEVLAVGDMAFQKRCLGKMNDVAKQGRTVLFVSHNMGAVRALCERGLVIDRGQIVHQGPIGESIARYYQLTDTTSTHGSALPATGSTRFGTVKLEGRESSTVDQSESMEVSVDLRIADEISGLTLLCLLVDMQQRTVFHLREDSSSFASRKSWKGVHTIRLTVPPMWLEPGMYSLYFKALLQGQTTSGRHVSDSLNIDISGSASGWGAVLTPRATWEIRETGE